MQECEYVFCPYCGQQQELVIDLSAGSSRFTTDCEVCCRPFEVAVEVRDGAVASLDVYG
jgi:transcription elongation factor Elf1